MKLFCLYNDALFSFLGFLYLVSVVVTPVTSFSVVPRRQNCHQGATTTTRVPTLYYSYSSSRRFSSLIDLNQDIIIGNSETSFDTISPEYFGLQQGQQQKYKQQKDEEDLKQPIDSVPSPRLTRLSSNPLLFISSSPILTESQCDILLDWCKDGSDSNGSMTDASSNNNKWSSSPSSSSTSENSSKLENGVMTMTTTDQVVAPTLVGEGENIMSMLQKAIHHQILGLGEEEDYVIPRFLSYDWKDYSHDDKKSAAFNKKLDRVTAIDDLIPDGLHVDTNNYQHARHWTVLVYLDSCKNSGATTFPLAIPDCPEFCNNIDGVHAAKGGRGGEADSGKTSADVLTAMTESSFTSSSTTITTTSQAMTNNIDTATATNIGASKRSPVFFEDQQERVKSDAQKAAEILLIENDLHHTRVSKNETLMELGKLVEEKAVELFQDKDSASSGIRVLPRKGHICVFSGLQQDGYPNPLSFHGGEAIMTKNECKNVLSFFFEIPFSSFSCRETFGEQVKQREAKFLQMHSQGLLQP